MNPYEILGVDKNASDDEIKKAYKKAAKTHHPDVGGSKDKFQEISNAYEILSDPAKKQEYDTFGEVGGNRGGPSGGFDPFRDFMSHFGFSRNTRHKKVGSNIHVKVKVSLIDVLKGCDKKITFNRNVSCSSCSGTGGDGSEKCSKCKGEGFLVSATRTPLGVVQQQIQCDVCDGGYVVANKCKTCKGLGVCEHSETIDVHLPAGITNGNAMQIKNYGNEVKNGITGILIVVVDEEKDDNFKRVDNDLKYDLSISIADAVLGTSKIIKAPLGDLKINIPEGCESDKIFFIKDKGIPILGNDGAIYATGNLYIKINIEIPKKLSKEEKKIFESLKKLQK
jgi:molecular chaperone DnaJ